MENIKIEEYSDFYLKETNLLLSNDINYIPQISSTKHSLLLLENQVIIGIGSVWNNFIHPYRDYISVYIIPEKRYEGLGKLLYNELKDRYQLKNLQSAFDSNDINAVNFTINCGFQLVRKSYCYGVNKESLKPFGYNISGDIIRVSDLNKTQLEDVIALQYKDYKLNHQRVNPLNENIKAEDWERIVYEELVKKDSYVLMKNKDIIAYLLCYEIDDRSVSIGYTGSRCNSNEDFKSFLYRTIKQLFTSYEQIELEIDDCDNSANIMGELFSYCANTSWDTYIKDF